MNDLSSLLPHGFNAILILLVAFLVKHELNDIKSRIVRIENTFFPAKKEGS